MLLSSNLYRILWTHVKAGFPAFESVVMCLVTIKCYSFNRSNYWHFWQLK